MKNQDILQIALQQSAYDCNCAPEDFLSQQNLVTRSRKHALARKYLPLPFACDMVSYGNNIVAQTSEELNGPVAAYLQKGPAFRCLEPPYLHVLDDSLEEFGLQVCFMAEYFLPDLHCLRALPCDRALRILHPSDFADLYGEPWSHALCESRRELDVLGVGAYADGRLIGLAACSADCETMYQIGVDVLPEYRRQGIASALTSRLALEILSLGKVPFYCAAWCNIPSVGNAIRSGFRPAWVEVTARDRAFVREMNACK